MYTRIFFILLTWVSLMVMSSTCKTIHVVKNKTNPNNVDTRDPRMFPFRWNLSNMFSNKKPAPVYLLSGTVCRYINMMPVCTYLSTSGVPISSQSGISSAQLMGSTQSQRPSGGQTSNLGGPSSGSSSGGGQTGSQSGGGQSGSGLSSNQGMSLGAIYAGNEPDKNIASLQFNPNTMVNLGNQNTDNAEDVNDRLQQATNGNSFLNQAALNQQFQQNLNTMSTRQTATKPIGFLILKQKPTSRLSNLLRVKSQPSTFNPDMSYVPNS